MITFYTRRRADIKVYCAMVTKTSAVMVAVFCRKS